MDEIIPILIAVEDALSEAVLRAMFEQSSRAHREAFASFLGIQKSQIPLSPEDLEDPKSFLLTLTKKSKKQSLKKAIIPAAGSTAKIGPDYNGVLISFVHNFWQVKEASKIFPSLNRAFSAIKAFRPVWTK